MPKSVKVRIKCLRNKGIITIEEMNRLIKALEEEQIEVVPHAKWIEEEFEGISYYFRNFPQMKIVSRRCSNCDLLSYNLYEYGVLKKDNYCRHCGAKMDKE